MNTYDVIIIGAGAVGASMALSLARHTDLKIALMDRQALTPLKKENRPSRVSAISPASKKWLESLDCWHSIEKKGASPYREMHIWDAKNKNTMHFDCQSVNASELGFIVENDVIRDSLTESLSLYANIDCLFDLKIEQLRSESDFITLTAKNGDTFHAALLIGADGAHSWVRQQSHIGLKQWHHSPRTAIIATIETALPHQKTAWQTFLPEGPLAFLPLHAPHQCSIVWSCPTEKADALINVDEKEFCHQLQKTIENTLGEITLLSSRYAYPLQTAYADTTIHPRVALIGDAAHTIHPLAGQGMNLGLADANCLSTIIINAHKKNRDIASHATLRRYERARKTDTLAMLAGTEAIHALFSTDDSLSQAIRSIGWKGIDRCSLVKDFLVRYAMGDRDNS